MLGIERLLSNVHVTCECESYMVGVAHSYPPHGVICTTAVCVVCSVNSATCFVTFKWLCIGVMLEEKSVFHIVLLLDHS